MNIELLSSKDNSKDNVPTENIEDDTTVKDETKKSRRLTSINIRKDSKKETVGKKEKLQIEINKTQEEIQKLALDNKKLKKKSFQH